jgi:hydrogenase nickel incorporation protein HypA/HybF
MHELSLSCAILETVERHAAGRKVTTVNLTVGALRQVVPDSLDFYFGIVTEGSVCEGARLEQTLVPGRARCEACGTEWGLDLPVFLCRECGGTAEPVSGEEFEVDSIEVKNESSADAAASQGKEPACTAPR